jgi:guanylate kinase
VDVLEARLKKRNSESAQVIQKRLAVAKQEVAQWKNFDYLLFSTTKPEDLRRMMEIVDAEKMRVTRSVAPDF